MDNKDIFSKNLQYQMDINGKSRQDISDALGISYYTITSWVNGSKYPRINKIEQLANYFGILISDLVEEKTEEHPIFEVSYLQAANKLAGLVQDTEFIELYEAYCKLSKKNKQVVKGLIDVLI